MQLSSKAHDYIYAAGAGFALVLLAGMFIFVLLKNNNGDGPSQAEINRQVGSGLAEPSLNEQELANLEAYRLRAGMTSFVASLNVNRQSKIEPAKLPEELFFLFSPAAVRDYYAEVVYTGEKTGYRIIYEIVGTAEKIRTEIEDSFSGAENWTRAGFVADDTGNYILLEYRSQKYFAVTEILALPGGRAYADMRIISR